MSRKRVYTKSKSMLESKDMIESYIAVFECRVCLQAAERSGGLQMLGPWIEKWKSDGCTIAQDFEKVTNIQVLPTDNNTKFICNSCLMKLKVCLLFIKTARNSDDILHKRYNTPTFVSPTKPLWPKPIQIDKVVGSDHLDVEVKQEVVSDDEPVKETEEQDNEELRMDIIDEPVKETEEQDNEELRMDIKVEPEEYQYKEIPIHGIFSNDNIIKVNGDPHIDNNPDVEIKEEPLSEQEDVEMIPDMPLDCMLCMKTFNSVSGLKAHVIAQHSYVTIDRKVESKKQLFTCTTCRRNFFTNTDLIVHETCHYAHACYMCNNKFDSFAQLTKHRKKCPKNTKSVTRVKTLEDVKRPSPEPQQLLEDKGSKPSPSVPESDEIDSGNTEVKSPIDINNSIESNTMEIDNEQQTSVVIEQTKTDDSEVLNDQVLEDESLVADSPHSELNNPNIEMHEPETETNAAKTNYDEPTLESNDDPIDDSILEIDSSKSDFNNTIVESNDIEMASKTSNLDHISAEDNNILNLELPIPSRELNSKDTAEPLETSGNIEEIDTVTTTVVIGSSENTTSIINSNINMESNSPNSESVEPKPESSLTKETYSFHSQQDSPHPETNSPHSETNSPNQETNSPHPETNRPHPEINSPDTEIIGLHPKSVTPDPEVVSPQIESISLNPEVSPDLESNNSPIELNPHLESNPSIELNSDLPESANENKPEEQSGDNGGSTQEEVDSDMKILLEIHSLDKKVSIDKENDIQGLDTVELNEDNVLQ